MAESGALDALPGMHDNLNTVLLLVVEDFVAFRRLGQGHLMRDDLQQQRDHGIMHQPLCRALSPLKFHPATTSKTIETAIMLGKDLRMSCTMSGVSVPSSTILSRWGQYFWQGVCAATEGIKAWTQASSHSC